jgi:hypothetical protein
MNGVRSAVCLTFALPAIIILASCGEQRMPTAATKAGVPDASLSRDDNGSQLAGAFVAHDSCDPDSFNAANGPGTCLKQGRTTFTEFIAELQATQVARDWRFTPDQMMAQRGSDMLGNNVGGTKHTFTPVKQYGGGINPTLNKLSDNPVEAPECSNLKAEDIIASGGRTTIGAQALSEVADASGVARVQCCIHPWMRSEVKLKSL